MHVSCELAELTSRDEASLTHNKVGQLQLAQNDDELQPARYSPLAIAASHGVMCVVDGHDVRVCRTPAIVQAMSDMQHQKDVTCTLAQLAQTIIPFKGDHAVAGVALNCNSSLLAAWVGLTIHVYSVQAVVENGTTQPLTSWYTDDSARIRQVLWSPNDVQRCIALTQHDQLLLGDLGRELQAAISHATCAAWSPNGRFLVFGWGDEVHVYDTASSTECWSAQIVPQAQDPENEDPCVDSLMWVSPNCILVCSDLGDNADEAHVAVLRWESWDVANPQQHPEGLTAEEAWPGFCSVADPTLDYGDRRPHLKGVQVPSWGLVAVADRNAVDDHVQFLEAPENGSEPSILEVEHRPVVGFKGEGEDNHVIGMGLDLTATDVFVPHPQPDKEGLPPMPLLFLLTADHKLEVWSVISTELSSEGLVKPPLALEPPPAFEPAAASPQKQHDLSKIAESSTQASSNLDNQAEAAVSKALPSDDDDLDEEEEQTAESPGPLAEEEEAQIQQTLSAADKPLPSDNSEVTEQEEWQMVGSKSAEEEEQQSQFTVSAAAKALPDDDDLAEDEEKQTAESAGFQAEAEDQQTLPAADKALRDDDNLAEDEEGQTAESAGPQAEAEDQQTLSAADKALPDDEDLAEDEEEQTAESVGATAEAGDLRSQALESQASGTQGASITDAQTSAQTEAAIQALPADGDVSEEEGQGETGGVAEDEEASKAHPVANKGFGDAKTETETETGSGTASAFSQAAMPMRSAKLKVPGLESDDDEEEGHGGSSSHSSAASSSSSVESPAQSRMTHPGGFPAPATTAAKLSQAHAPTSSSAAVGTAQSSSSAFSGFGAATANSSAAPSTTNAFALASNSSSGTQALRTTDATAGTGLFSGFGSRGFSSQATISGSGNIFGSVAKGFPGTNAFSGFSTAPAGTTPSSTATNIFSSGGAFGFGALSSTASMFGSKIDANDSPATAPLVTNASAEANSKTTSSTFPSNAVADGSDNKITSGVSPSSTVADQSILLGNKAAGTEAAKATEQAGKSTQGGAFGLGSGGSGGGGALGDGGTGGSSLFGGGSGSVKGSATIFGQTAAAANPFARASSINVSIPPAVSQPTQRPASAGAELRARAAESRAQQTQQAGNLKQTPQQGRAFGFASGNAPSQPLPDLPARQQQLQPAPKPLPDLPTQQDQSQPSASPSKPAASPVGPAASPVKPTVSPVGVKQQQTVQPVAKAAAEAEQSNESYWNPEEEDAGEQSEASSASEDVSVITPDRPEAQLSGEGPQVAAWEADFLEDLYKIRKLRAEMQATVQQVQGSSGRHANTMAGYDQLAHQIKALQEDVQRSKSSARHSRNTVDSLLGDARAGIQQREALVHFHAPDHSQTSLQQKALMKQGPLEPALQSRRDQLMARTPELKTKARELDAALEVLGDRRAGPNGSRSPQAAALQLYDVINAQSTIIKSQMERLQLLMRHAKSHRLPIEASADDSDPDDEDLHDKMISVKAAQERLKSIQNLAGSSPGRSPGGLQTPNRSPLSGWQSVKRSPASQSKHRQTWTQSPSPRKAIPGTSTPPAKDVWAGERGRRVIQQLKADADKLAKSFATGDQRNTSPTKGLLTSPGPRAYKDGLSDITFAVRPSSSQNEGSAVTMQSIHMQGSQDVKDTTMNSRRSGSLSRQESGGSVQSPFQPGKATAAGARATAQAKRAQQGGLFQIPEQSKRSVTSEPLATAADPRTSNRHHDPSTSSQFAAADTAAPASGAAAVSGNAAGKQAAATPPKPPVNQHQAAKPSVTSSQNNLSTSKPVPKTPAFIWPSSSTQPAAAASVASSPAPASAAPSSSSAATPVVSSSSIAAAIPPSAPSSSAAAAAAGKEAPAGASRPSSTSSSRPSSASSSKAAPAASAKAPSAGGFPPMPSKAQMKAAQQRMEDFKNKPPGKSTPAKHAEPAKPAGPPSGAEFNFPSSAGFNLSGLSSSTSSNVFASTPAFGPSSSSVSSGAFGVSSSSASSGAFGASSSSASSAPLAPAFSLSSFPVAAANASAAAASASTALSGLAAPAFPPSSAASSDASSSAATSSSAGGSLPAFGNLPAFGVGAGQPPSGSVSPSSSAAPSSSSGFSALSIQPSMTPSANLFGQPAPQPGSSSAASVGTPPAFGMLTGQSSSPAASTGIAGFGMSSSLTANVSQSSAGTFGSSSAASTGFGAAGKQSSGFGSFGSSTSNPFGVSTSFGQSSSSIAAPFGQSSSSAPGHPFGQSSSSAPSNPFGQSSSSAAAAFGQSSSSAAAPFGQSSSSAAGPFGQSSSSAAAPFGQSSSSASANPFGQPASSSSFGFGGLGFGSSSSASSKAVTSPFGKGLSFGGSAASPSAGFGIPPAASSAGFGTPNAGFGTPSAIGGFGAPTSAPFGASAQSQAATANPFGGGFGGSGNAFGQSAASSSPFGSGFGTPSKPGGGFGQAAGIGGFGTPAPFGAPATPNTGFGASATPSAGFGAPATPNAGFGTPTAGNFGNSFGSFAQPSSPYGGVTPGNAFGAAAQQGGNAFGNAAQQSNNAFGGAAQQGGNAFGSTAQQGGNAFGGAAPGFGGGFGGGGGAFGRPKQPSPQSSSGMWSLRK